MISGPLPDQQNLHNYRLIKHQMQLPLKIHLYFTFLEAALENDQPIKHSHSSQAFSPLFYSIFCQLSPSEKAYYLHSNISFLKRQYDKFKSEASSTSCPVNNGNNLTASGQISQTIMGLTYWGKLKISFTFQNKQVKLETKNRTFCIDLRLYLLRKSKKYKSTLVLEAISDIVTSKDRKLSLFFKQNIFEKIYEQLLNCIMTYRNQELFKIALEQSATHNQLSTEVSYIGNKSKSLNFLSSKNINDFLNFKDFVLKKILKADFNFQNLFTNNSCKIGFDHNKNRKNHIYKMEASFEMPVESLKKLFLEKYKSQSFKHMIQSQDLQKFSQKFSAVYQKLLFQKSQSFHEVEQIIVEQINDKDTLCQNQELIFQKGVNNIKINPFIQFLMVKVKGLGASNKSKLIVVASFNEIMKDQTNGSHCIADIQESQQVIAMFLLEFYEIVNRKEVEVEEIQKMLKQLRSFDGFTGQKESKSVAVNDFITVEGNFGNDYQNELVLDTDELDTVEDNGDQIMINAKQIQQQNFKKGALSLDSKALFPSKTPIVSISSSQVKTLQSNSYLKHNYQLSPQPLGQTKQKLCENHFLFDEWERKSKGGLICKDNTVVNEQKKIANHLLSNLGKRILDNKGIFNMSLPVNIFKPESHLESVAKNLSFAPIALENASEMNPVERIKKCALYSLFMTISSISVSKPFNPIIGQTLQKWIDGCPVYLQQISHHPPIVAYYMLGRGYKAYGRIGPKASFGFNSLIGYSDEPNFIEFDDGTIIEVSFGKMVISGIVLGERSFNFEDQMFVIDSKNRLFCSMRLGKEKGSFFSISSEHDDCVNGKIVRVTESFIKQFYSHSKAIYPKNDDQQEQISTLQGIWNGKIFFDEKQYADFNTANGCQISNEQFILPSDSSYREDIEYLKKGMLSTSQSEKQKVEETQRRDEKLRKNFEQDFERNLTFQ